MRAVELQHDVGVTYVIGSIRGDTQAQDSVREVPTLEVPVVRERLEQSRRLTFRRQGISDCDAKATKKHSDLAISQSSEFRAIEEDRLRTTHICGELIAVAARDPSERVRGEFEECFDAPEDRVSESDLADSFGNVEPRVGEGEYELVRVNACGYHSAQPGDQSVEELPPILVEVHDKDGVTLHMFEDQPIGTGLEV
jgi:hypothetical protein